MIKYHNQVYFLLTDSFSVTNLSLGGWMAGLE